MHRWAWLPRLVIVAALMLAACAPANLPGTPGTAALVGPTATATAISERPPVTRTPTPAGAPAASPTPVTPTLGLAPLAAWEAPAAHALAWLPGGQALAVSSDQGVYIYQAANLQQQQFIDLQAWVYQIAISPDGLLLAAAVAPAGLRLWDLRAGRRLTEIDSTMALTELTGVGSLAFSPDGRRLAVGVSGAVLLWDTTTGKLLYTWQQDTYLGGSNVGSVAFSHDGRYVAADSGPGMWLMEAASGLLLHRLERPGEYFAISRIAFSADDRVVVGAGGGQISFWEVETGRLRRLRRLEAYAAVALSRDGLRVAGVGNGYIALTDAVTGQARPILTGHTGYAAAFAYSPDSALLAALDANATLSVWDTGNGQRTATLDRHISWLGIPALSPDAQTLAWGSGHRVWLWDLHSGQPPRPVFTQPDLVASVAFSPDGRWLASGGAAPMPRRVTGGPTAAVRLWDLANSRLRQTLRTQGYTVSALAFSPNSRTLATGGDDTIIRLWDLPSGQLRRELTGHLTSPLDLAFTPDGRQLLSLAASDEGCYEACQPGYLSYREEPDPLRLWDVEGGQGLTVFESARYLCATELALAPDGRRFLVNQCSSVGAWDLTSGQGPRRLRLPTPLTNLVFSPDGRTLAGLHEGSVLMVDAVAGALLAAAAPEEPSVSWLTFRADGSLLAWGHADGSVRVWVARLGQRP